MPRTCDEVFDDVLIGHLFDGCECGHGSVERFGGEIAKGKHFVVREAGGAKLLVGAIEQMLRRRVVAEAAEGLEAGEQTSVDGGCGFAVKLLINDGLGQCFEGRLLGGKAQREGAGAFDEPGELRVRGRERGYGDAGIVWGLACRAGARAWHGE